MLSLFNNQVLNYIAVFLIAVLISFLFCGYLVLRSRKDKIKSRLAGAFIIILFWLIVICFLPLKGALLGALFASLIILFFGLLDDFKNLSPPVQFLGQVLAAVIAISFGILITYITNPFGGIFYFDFLKIAGVSLASFFITLLWFLVVMNAMNWLDGLDGLSGGVSAISAMALFFLSIAPFVNQPQTALLALILAGIVFGFLVFNTYPSKILMGTSGSMFLGFILATIAIISGGKIATAALVMGLPLLDFVFVIIKRLKEGQPIWKGDRRHLHYLLEKRGFTTRQIVIFYYLIAGIFGIAALLTASFGKLVLLGFLIVFGLVIWRLTLKTVNS